MPRVAGVDPGTVSFDLCVLQDGEPVLERVFESGALGLDPRPLLDALADHGPFDLVYGPSGYGLPLVAAADVGERELAEMVLVRADEAHAATGVSGMRSLLRTLAGSGLPVVFGPGVIHLPTVPAHRKYNRIDMGTADKVCAAAYAITDQARRHGVAPHETSMIMLELGGAFTAALAIDGGRIVDGAGGSSGPLGVRACGALDGEVAYLLAPGLGKDTLFTGGAFDRGGARTGEGDELWSSPSHAGERRALIESAAKAVRSLAVTVITPREVVISGRLARERMVVEALSSTLGDLAPVVTLPTGVASAAAYGAAMLADGLSGGRYRPLLNALSIHKSSGTALDHLRVAGVDLISLG
jgi:predicted butyrate kinase (DUF1464 family)